MPGIRSEIPRSGDHTLLKDAQKEIRQRLMAGLDPEKTISLILLFIPKIFFEIQKPDDPGPTEKAQRDPFPHMLYQRHGQNRAKWVRCSL
jgi:hypothetical protein